MRASTNLPLPRRRGLGPAKAAAERSHNGRTGVLPGWIV